jgi:hypothetical protein
MIILSKILGAVLENHIANTEEIELRGSTLLTTKPTTGHDSGASATQLKFSKPISLSYTLMLSSHILHSLFQVVTLQNFTASK